MHKSELIWDHSRRKDVFVVDLANGDVSVMKDAAVKQIISIQQQEINQRTETGEVDVQFYRNKLREISASAKAALGE